MTRKDLGLYYRHAICNKNIPNHPTIIERHNGSKFHKMILELLDKQGIFIQWNVVWDVVSKSAK